MQYSTRCIVGIATASLGLLAVFLPGAYGSFSNSLAIACGIVPMALLVSICRSLPPNGLGQFLCGVALIAIGMIFFAFASFLPEAIDAFFQGFNKEAGTSYKKSAIGFGEISLWIYLVPAVSTGIGVNLISSHLTASGEREV